MFALSLWLGAFLLHDPFFNAYGTASALSGALPLLCGSLPDIPSTTSRFLNRDVGDAVPYEYEALPTFSFKEEPI